MPLEWLVSTSGMVAENAGADRAPLARPCCPKSSARGCRLGAGASPSTPASADGQHRRELQAISKPFDHATTPFPPWNRLARYSTLAVLDDFAGSIFEYCIWTERYRAPLSARLGLRANTPAARAA